MAVRWSVDFENNMASVQRLMEYSHLESERQDAAYQIDFQREQNSVGKIDFNDVEMRYRPNLKPALRSLTFKINPGVRVAVVGRTGAGKSSLYQLLTGFRDANSGVVTLDNMDISKIRLDILRNEISMVH